VDDGRRDDDEEEGETANTRRAARGRRPGRGRIVEESDEEEGVSPAGGGEGRDAGAKDTSMADLAEDE